MCGMTRVECLDKGEGARGAAQRGLGKALDTGRAQGLGGPSPTNLTDTG